MPSITWPTGTVNDPFPQIPNLGLDAGYPEDMHYVFSTGSGKEKTRPKSTKPRKRLSTPIELTGAQLAVFEDWFMNTLIQGTANFEWIDFITGETATLRFVGSKYPKFELVTPADNYVTPKSESGGEVQRRYTSNLDLERVA